MQLPPSTPQLKGPIRYQPMAVRDLVAFHKEAWGKGRQTFGAGLGANKRPPSVTAHSSSSLLLCPLSLEPDARGAQQPAAAARDNSLDVRVWWPRAAKNNYLMQGLGHGWKHPHPTGSSERRSRKNARLPPPSPSPLMHSARAISLNPTSVQVICFALSITKQTTGPLPPPRRCSCERPCLTTLQKWCQ